MMIVTKNDKHLYAFLKDAFNVMGRSTSNKFLMGDNGTLYFNTFYIKGKITVNRYVSKKGALEEEPLYSFDQHFYTLKMLDDKSFELKEGLQVAKTGDESEELRKQLINEFENLWNICTLDKDSSTVIATLTQYSNFLIPDRYVGLISKLGDCSVYKKDKSIVCTKRESVDKENVTVETSLLFVCDYDQPGEE